MNAQQRRKERRRITRRLEELNTLALTGPLMIAERKALEKRLEKVGLKERGDEAAAESQYYNMLQGYATTDEG